MMKKIFLLIILVLTCLFFFGYWYLSNTKPIYQGEISLAGLHSPVKVKYDDFGIPHIYAERQSDAYFALGYVQAQERLFQMEMIRRVSTGTLAEILGPDFVDVDMLFRTLGFAKKSTEFAKQFEENKSSELILVPKNT